MSYIIVDIDGTVTDPTHRLHHIEKKPADWDAFYDAAKNDPPIQGMVDFLKWIISEETDAVFITGRSERIRQDTHTYLSFHGLYVWELLMRKEGDYRPDTIVKAELYEEYLKRAGKPPIAVFEDRDAVVQMWRELGLLCLQPKKGDY